MWWRRSPSTRGICQASSRCFPSASSSSMSWRSRSVIFWCVRGGPTAEAVGFFGERAGSSFESYDRDLVTVRELQDFLLLEQDRLAGLADEACGAGVGELFDRR